MQTSQTADSTGSKAIARLCRMLFCLALVGPGPAWAEEGEEDGAVLWLPASAGGLQAPLRRAAKQAREAGHCPQVLEGTLDGQASRSGSPIFRLLCRSEGGLTFGMLVDAASGEPLTAAQLAGAKPLGPEAMARARQRRQQALLKAAHARCAALWSDRAALFDPPLGPVEFIEMAVEDGVQLAAPVTARNAAGHPLQLTAQCDYSGPDTVVLDLLPAS